MYINKAMVFGNLTRDPEMKALPSGIKVCNFSLATNRTWKNKDGAKQESTDFHNIVVFGRQAELVSQYLRKGSSAYIEGRMQTRSWDADGGKKYRTEVIADTIQFGPRTGGAGGGSYAGDNKGDSQNDAPMKAPELETIEYPEDDINPEDIPF